MHAAAAGHASVASTYERSSAGSRLSMSTPADGDGSPSALSTWLSLRLSREVRRLASLGQRALPLPVTASRAERRRVPTGGGEAVFNVLRVDTSFDFSRVQSLLVSSPERIPAPAAHVGATTAAFVVLIVSDKPDCPCLLCNAVYDDDAVSGNDLRFFVFAREDGSETVIEVRDAATVAAAPDAAALAAPPPAATV